MLLFNVDRLKELVKQAECVSFDVFDTLLIRDKFLNPTDVFYFLARQHGLDHKTAIQFKLDRIKSEALHRELFKIESQSSEIHISRIYKSLNMYGISFQDEIAFETRILKPRKLVFDIYQYAKECGKLVVAVSDIYFTSKELSNILLTHGIEPDGIYTSCESGYGKYECKLYEKLLSDRDIKPNCVIHIGDNISSDYFSAMKVGITSVLIEKQSTQLFTNSSLNLNTIHHMVIANDSGLTLYGAIVAHLAKYNDAINTLSAAQLFGIIYATPLLFCFCGWLNIKAKEDGVKKLFLMARDGFAIANVFDRIGCVTDYEIIKISRKSVSLPAASIRKSLWTNFFASAGEKKIKSILSDLEIECLEDICNSLQERGNETYNSLSEIAKDEFIKQSYSIAFPQMQRECADLQKYFERIGLTATDVAVVDVGWSLSSQKSIELILGKKLRGYYLGKNNNSYSHEMINAYLFDGFSGTDAAWEPIFNAGVELLELPFISNKKQFARTSLDDNAKQKDSIYDNIRFIISNEISSEVSKFLDETKDLLQYFTGHVDETLVLQKMFSNLISNPTASEFQCLGSIPHDRYIAGSGIEVVANFWKKEANSSAHNADINWKSAFFIVLKNIRTHGYRVTYRKIIKRMASWK